MEPLRGIEKKKKLDKVGLFFEVNYEEVLHCLMGTKHSPNSILRGSC